MVPWISDTTWKISDQRKALGRKSRTNKGECRVLTRRFHAALKEDRRSRERGEGEEIKALVSKYQVREAWNKNQQWYREAKGNQVPPTSEQLYQTSTLWEDPYMHRPPEGKIILILVQPVSFEDGTPEVGKIAAAAIKLRPGRSGGTSGMKVEHLKAWLWAATKEKDPDNEMWDKLVSVIKVAF